MTTSTVIDVESGPKAVQKPRAPGEYPKGGPSILIIGAGIGGISLAYEFNKRGLTNWQIYEREGGVGGTWWVNRYPGCRCDVAAVVYSHSKFPNPNWSQTHPPREEIQKYWEDIARKQGYISKMHFGKNVEAADWDAKRAVYTVRIRDTQTKETTTVEANIVVSAFGLLSNPRHIDLPGQDTFEGTVLHAAEWPEDLTNEKLHGKKVVVVGNGCSGVQIVTTLAEDPEIELVALSRAKQWFAPNPPGEARNSIPYPKSKNELWARFPVVQTLTRWMYCTIMDSHWYWFLTADGAKFRAETEAKLAAWMRASLPAEIADEMVPKYSFGAKRIIREDGYFAALSKDNVTAVTGKIASFTPQAIVLDDGREMSADVVVLATGYDAEAVDVDVAGTNDRTKNYTSKADWAQYHGIALSGIPNYFTILGNNMGFNHMSITAVLEINASYIAQLVEAMRDYSIPALDVKRPAAEAYAARIQRDLEKTTWHQVSNYWRGNNGTGKIFTHYPGSVRSLWWDNLSPIWADYDGAERVVRGQRRRRILLMLLTLIALVWGAKRNAGTLKALFHALLHSASNVRAVLDKSVRTAVDKINTLAIKSSQ